MSSQSTILFLYPFPKCPQTPPSLSSQKHAGGMFLCSVCIPFMCVFLFVCLFVFFCKRLTAKWWSFEEEGKKNDKI